MATCAFDGMELEEGECQTPPSSPPRIENISSPVLRNSLTLQRKRIQVPLDFQNDSLETMDYSKPKQYKVDLRERIAATQIFLPEGTTDDLPKNVVAERIAKALREVGL